MHYPPTRLRVQFHRGACVTYQLCWMIKLFKLFTVVHVVELLMESKRHWI
ncbi:hypothetical protein HYC85_013472 [Camellia sinensis]|uniref:Uncharacterized protein n=1 Tax=Camellia sinensis TaxID=4442 RepID=A0A7J7H4S5_CAMSI|nr:hypothetical protein HYC85_013472 [Camellia sinensis]